MKGAMFSVGVTRTYTMINPNEYAIALGYGSVLGELFIPVKGIQVYGIDIYQRNSNPESIAIERVAFGNRTVIDNVYPLNGEINPNIIYPEVFSFSNQDGITLIQSSPYATAKLGFAVGDFAEIRFDKPILLIPGETASLSQGEALAIKVTPAAGLQDVDWFVTFYCDLIMPDL